MEEREDGDEDAVQEADKERSTRCRRRTKGAAVTGATTTDLMVGNVTGAGGKKVKKRKRVNEVAKEEVSEEEKEVSEVEEEEEEEKEEKEEEETDATNATGINCYVLQCINNVVDPVPCLFVSETVPSNGDAAVPCQGKPLGESSFTLKKRSRCQVPAFT
jgi:hypothetical protein